MADDKLNTGPGEKKSRRLPSLLRLASPRPRLLNRPGPQSPIPAMW